LALSAPDLLSDTTVSLPEAVSLVKIAQWRRRVIEADDAGARIWSILYSLLSVTSGHYLGGTLPSGTPAIVGTEPPRYIADRRIPSTSSTLAVNHQEMDVNNF